MSTTITLSSTHTAVPLSRFEPICDSADALRKLLKPETHTRAQEGYAELVDQHEKLRGEKLVLENAQQALAAAKLALKAAQAQAKLAVPTAINLGKMADIGAIANFEPKDESWIESVDELASRFRAHGAGGKWVATTLQAQASRLRESQQLVERETEALDRASQAFSATYRHLSNAITYGRAVLINLGITVPAVHKAAGKKQPRKVVEVPVSAPSAPALVPGPVVLASAA